MNEDIERLKHLTANLPAFPETTSKQPGFKRHKMQCGTSLSWDLDPDAQHKAANAKWYNSCGTQFPGHKHESREWLIVIEGSMFLTVEDQEKIRLLPGMSAVIEPNTWHSAEFVEDCWYYAITVPRDPNWP